MYTYCKSFLQNVQHLHWWCCNHYELIILVTIFHVTYLSVSTMAGLRFVIFRVWQFLKVGQSHSMGEVGNETNVQCLIVCVINVPKLAVIAHPLFKLLKMQSHVFTDCICWLYVFYMWHICDTWVSYMNVCMFHTWRLRVAYTTIYEMYTSHIYVIYVSYIL